MSYGSIDSSGSMKPIRDADYRKSEPDQTDKPKITKDTASAAKKAMPNTSASSPSQSKSKQIKASIISDVSSEELQETALPEFEKPMSKKELQDKGVTVDLAKCESDDDDINEQREDKVELLSKKLNLNFPTLTKGRLIELTKSVERAAGKKETVKMPTLYDLGRLVDFVETNRNQLTAIARKKQAPVYLRRESTTLPFSMQVIPEGKVLIHLKRKGKIDSFGGGGQFKAITESLDYDTAQSYVNATATAEPQVMARELSSIARMKGVPGAIQLVSSHGYHVKEGGHKAAKTGNAEKINIVMEMCDKGDLEQNYDTGFTLTEKLDIAETLFKYNQHIHEEMDPSYAHLDLKPKNILLDSEKGVRIGDFGNMMPCKELPKTIKSGWKTANFRFMHPKIFSSRSARKDVDAGKKIDNFAAGMSLALIELGIKEDKLPWADDASRNNTKGIKKKTTEFHASFPENNDFQRLVKSLIDPKNWEQFPSEKEILSRLSQIRAKGHK